jgi:hypothetical protein
MTHKAITFKFVVPTVLAIALGVMLSIGTVHLTDKYPAPVDPAEADYSVAGSRGTAELPSPDARLSRVRLVLSSMK